MRSSVRSVFRCFVLFLIGSLGQPSEQGASGLGGSRSPLTSARALDPRNRYKLRIPIIQYAGDMTCK